MSVREPILVGERRIMMTRGRQAARSTHEPEAAVVDVPDAAKVLGICRTSAYQAIKRGEIPSTSIGRRLLVPVPALDKMLGRDQA